MLAPKDFMQPPKARKSGRTKVHPDYPNYDGDIEGPYSEKFKAELREALAESRADRARGINRAIPIEQVMKNLGLDNNN